LDVITMEQLLELLDVKNQQTAIQFLRGQAPHSLASLEDLRRDYAEGFAAKLAELPQALMVVSQTSTEVPAPAAAAVLDEAVEPEEPLALTAAQLLDPSDMALTLAILVGFMLPVAQQLVDDEQEAHERFRRLIGQPQSPNLLLLVDLLEALRTKASMRQYRERQ
jgi:hypothetical protein